MNNLYQTETYQSIIARLDNLTPDSQRLWGKMDVSQMMAHCVVGIQMAVGDVKPGRSFLGFLVGRFYKGMLTGAIKMPKNSPTSAAFLITDQREFEQEKTKLKALLERMYQGGAAGATAHPNPFFGKLTPDEWGQGQFQHLDHHLKQFGM